VRQGWTTLAGSHFAVLLLLIIELCLVVLNSYSFGVPTTAVGGLLGWWAGSVLIFLPTFTIAYSLHHLSSLQTEELQVYSVVV